MKYQQVSVDLVNMMTTACSYLALAGAAWVLLRLLQACFWLPRHFRKQTDVQKLLQDKVDSYEKYLAECEARDKLVGTGCSLEDTDDATTTRDVSESSDKWRGQRETLEMLKKELNRIRDGIDVSDWDYLLEESQTKAVNSENDNEGENEIRKDLKKEEAASTTKVLKKEEAASTTKVLTEKKDEEPGIKCTDQKKDK